MSSWSFKHNAKAVYWVATQLAVTGKAFQDSHGDDGVDAGVNEDGGDDEGVEDGVEEDLEAYEDADADADGEAEEAEGGPPGGEDAYGVHAQVVPEVVVVVAVVDENAQILDSRQGGESVPSW